LTRHVAGIGLTSVHSTAAARPTVGTFYLEHSEIRDCANRVGDGSVRRLQLSIGDVNEAFARCGNAAAAQNVIA